MPFPTGRGPIALFVFSSIPAVMNWLSPPFPSSTPRAPYPAPTTLQAMFAIRCNTASKESLALRIMPVFTRVRSCATSLVAAASFASKTPRMTRTRRRFAAEE